MEEQREEQELIPGTNIPRPRYRGIYETDEEYVEYLKQYYGEYFPEVVNETVEVNENPEISDSELQRIQTNLESYANTIQEEYTESSNDSIEEEKIVEDFSFDTESIKMEDSNDDFSFDIGNVSLENNEDEFSFDMESANSDFEEAIEIESFTESNDKLKRKAKLPALLNKASTFFKNITTKFVDFIAEANDSILEENVALAGKVR